MEQMEEVVDKTTKAIVLINPNNPTGAMFSREIIQKIIDLCKRKKLLLISDEIYDQLILDDNAEMIYPGVLTNEVPIISVNGFSKNYLSPGWRIGWMVFQNMKNESEFVNAIKKICDARLCACHPLQASIPVALDGPKDHFGDTISKIKKRRDVVLDKLSTNDRISFVTPKATFYVMVKIDGIKDDEEFVKKLVAETGVLFVHGSGFGMNKRAGFVRIVYLPPEDILSNAMDKIQEFIK